MGGPNYYLITSLPRLGELGSEPPWTLRELLAHVAEGAGATEIVTTIILADDLLKRQAVLAGEIAGAEPAVLTIEQLRDRQPLPDFVAPQPAEAPLRIAAVTDAVWEAYFRHAAGVAQRTGSAFLARWVGYEVALRNALAAARAKALGLESGGYLVATDLGATRDDLSAVVSAWSGAASPLAGERVLDAARWDWLTRHDTWFSFQDDEVAAYAAKLVLLHRWQRLTSQEPTDTARVAT